MMGAFGNLRRIVERQSTAVSFSSARSIRTFVSTAINGGFGMVKPAINNRHSLFQESAPLLIGIFVGLCPRLFGNDGSACLNNSAGRFHSWINNPMREIKNQSSN